LRNRKSKELQKTKTNESSKNGQQNIRGVGDTNIANCRVISPVVRENWKLLDVGANNIRRQHQQRLADAIPVVELASDEDKLRQLLEDHTLAEESRVFPRAKSAYKERSVAKS